jgi:hypothetical protein
MHNINLEHPEYVANRAVWKRYKDLYAGGELFRNNASEYMIRRSKEPNEVYFERLSRVFYENYIGSIIDWYAATLMRREPVLQFNGPNETGVTFFSNFVRDCDLKGTPLTEFFRQRLAQTLVYGKSYIALDFPRVGGPVRSRAEEDAIGRSRAYLVDYSPEDVINWSYDDSGRLEWIVLRTSYLRQGSVGESAWNKETRWLYYDCESYRIYRQ